MLFIITSIAFVRIILSIIKSHQEVKYLMFISMDIQQLHQ